MPTRVVDQQVQDRPTADADDREPVTDITDRTARRCRKGGRRVHVHGRRAPDDAHQLVEEQDEAEGREDLVQMVAAVEPDQRHALDDDPEQHRGRHADQAGQHERAGPVEHGRRVRPTAQRTVAVHEIIPDLASGRGGEQQAASAGRSAPA
jgi:hypothetical protein